MSEMHVYIITNPAFDGWVKVGRATDLGKRLSSMQTGAPTPYAIEYSVKLYDDRPVHTILDNMGIERSLEWFKCDVETARKAVDEAVESVPDYVTDHVSKMQDMAALYDAREEVMFA